MTATTTTTTGFSTFQLVHGLEEVTPIECKIPSLKLSIQLSGETLALKEHLLHLERLDEQLRDALTTNEAHRQWVKSQYDKFVKPKVLCEGDLVLVYDQDREPFGTCNFESMWVD